MPSLPVLTRTLALITLGVALATGFAVGAGVNVAVGTRLSLPEGAEPAEYEDAPLSAKSTSTPEPPMSDQEGALPSPEDDMTFHADKRVFTDSVVRRNIFDSAATFSAAAGDATTQDCKDSKAQLLATVVASLPEYSSALISDGSKSSRANGYKVGDDVGSEGKILTIEQKKVCLAGGGCLCMGSDDKRIGGAVADAGTAAAEGDGVTKVSDTKFLVDRSFLEKQLGNVESLATQIRASPKTEDGAVVGFRLSAIRKGSVFDKLGIKNGDVVHTVNGQAMNSMETAMSAYGSLQNERGFNFEITRRNQKMTIEYEVR
ncbi:hypothetical protein LBMAG42_22830 [Deltaproteobacteria bacterium]|nr:hypothetical protein LBMAG42_22830 [Deltaproteobacteria bacterium]